MNPVRNQLDLSEKTFFETTRSVFPLFMNTPIVKAPEDPKNPRHWMFYTIVNHDTDSKGGEMNVIHMDVFKPNEILAVFKKVVQELYDKAYGGQVHLGDDLISRLLHDNYTYLFNHELLHPECCPNSKTDEEQFDKALYEGIQRANPRLSKTAILRKVGNVRNAGWDQVIDTRFFHMSNYGNEIESRLEHVLQQTNIPLGQIHRLADGVVSIFDVVEFEMMKKKEFDSMFYPLTRAVYSMMFTKGYEMRGTLFDYFKDRITPQMKEPEFNDAIRNALKGFVKRLTPEQIRFARFNRDRYNSDVDELLKSYNTPQGDGPHKRVIEIVNDLLVDKKSRYNSITGFIEELSKYISETKEEKRHGTHIGEGSGQGQSQPGQGQGEGQPEQGDGQGDQNQPGGNTEQALINLANVLGEGEANALLVSVAQDLSGGSQGGKSQKDKKLYQLASDEYYKRNTSEISIKSPDYESVSIDLGTKRVPEFIGSSRIPIQNVLDLPLEEIEKFQEQTGIIQLYQISPFEFAYDQYEWIEEQETDYAYENTGLELPDNVVFHVDSSLSMGSPQFVGTGSKFDTLMHVCYGILKTLRKASQEMKKEVQVISANFSNGTILSPPVELGHMYDTPNNPAKKALTSFQNGGTVYSPNAFDIIRKQSKPGKTVHVWISDGDLNEGGTEVYKKIEEQCQDPNTSFLYFEIGSASSFGNRILDLSRQRKNVKHYPNVSIKDIQSSALEVMLEYS